MYGASLGFHLRTPKIGARTKFHPEVPLEYLGQDDGGSEIHVESPLKRSTVSKKVTENELQRFSGSVMHNVYSGNSHLTGVKYSLGQ